MKNFIEILKGVGIELTDEQIVSVNKEVVENYKTVAEFDKKVSKLETERDGIKEQLTTAQETLKSFEGVDVDAMNRTLAEYKSKAEQSEAEFNRKMAERDFEDALNSALGTVKFSSSSARKSVIEEIKSKGLKVEGGKILGLDDALKSIKEQDADAFALEDEVPPAKFTDRMHNPTGKVYASKEDIMKIKDSAERQKAIAENLKMFTD